MFFPDNNTVLPICLPVIFNSNQWQTKELSQELFSNEIYFDTTVM